MSWKPFFWISVAGVVYPYVGYPLVLWVVAAMRSATPAVRLTRADSAAVTMIVPVHNEADRGSGASSRIRRALTIRPTGWTCCSCPTDRPTARWPRIRGALSPEHGGARAAGAAWQRQRP